MVIRPGLSPVPCGLICSWIKLNFGSGSDHVTPKCCLLTRHGDPKGTSLNSASADADNDTQLVQAITDMVTVKSIYWETCSRSALAIISLSLSLIPQEILYFPVNISAFLVARPLK